MKTVGEMVRDAEQQYLYGTTRMGKYVNWRMHDVIETIDAYLNSKHISGETDSLGRPKPFFNIVTAAVNIWYRATDLDRKDIRILPDKVSNTALAFIATVHLQLWMKKARFGVFLNQWGRTLARYGSAIVKFVEKDGELIPSVIPWNRFIADAVDFDAIPHIEKFYKTEEQLYKMARANGYDLNKVDELCSALQARRTLDNYAKDYQNDFIELYEVHGEMSQAQYLKAQGKEPKEGDDDIFFQQMHVVSLVAGEKESQYDEFVLYVGKEKQDPYMITHLIEEDGRTLSIGAVEYLFDAQWMQNHTAKNMKDTLDIASKLIFQTSDPRYTGRNVLNAIETGDIFIHAENSPLTRVANDKPDISALENYGTMWRQLAQEITATPDSMRGTNPPANQPWSTTSTLLQQGNSLFEIMTENKGLAVADMMTRFIIPFIKTKMDTKEEIVATLDSQEIAEIDAIYIPQEAIKRFNQEAVKKVLAMQPGQPTQPGSVPSPYQPQLSEQAVKDQLALMGNKRSFTPDELDIKTWKDVLKDLEWEVNVEVTNEGSDKQAVMTTLNTLFQTLASNPYILQNPNAKMVFDAILTETDRISPLQLQQVNSPAARMPNSTIREVVDFRDLPPAAKAQMLQFMGIQVSPEDMQAAALPRQPNQPPTPQTQQAPTASPPATGLPANQ
jgi:hypothetical protein